ncbi:MAG TPA: hypothetical protein VF690_20595 [Hymenobacter sp.]|jgi:hypothetical protein
MYPDPTPEELERERLEQALFIELIRLAPEGTELYITNDSWDGLPALLGTRMKRRVAENYEDWVIALTPDSRQFLVDKALLDNVQGTFVHFSLLSQSQELVASYDRMYTVVLAPEFPEHGRLVADYGDRLDCII